MKYLSLILFCFLSNYAYAQKAKKNIVSAPKERDMIVSFEVLENGDTINKLDNKNRKQGYWLHQVESRYGEEGYVEYGLYTNNEKQGLWNTYNNKGIILAQEKYKNGHKDGEARYYENGKLYCVGNYLALRSKHAYDTIMVEQPGGDEFKPVIIKSNTGSVKHGFWIYYDINTKKMIRILEYQADDVIYEKEYDNVMDTTYLTQRGKSLPDVSNQVPEGVWIPDKTKIPTTYTDLKFSPVALPQRDVKKKR